MAGEDDDAVGLGLLAWAAAEIEDHLTGPDATEKDRLLSSSFAYVREATETKTKEER